MLRFAPSPTGDMHIGNLRVAIFNYLMAKKLKQKFIIRIEDTDLERNIANKDQEILSLLQLFGLCYDEVLYQSNNFPLHRELAHTLIKNGKAFYCYCSKEFLESKREEAQKNKIPFRYHDAWAELEKGNRTTSPIIRLRANESIVFRDSIRGYLSFQANEIDSFVIMRNDIPTYNFACSIDDKEMSYIIRGEDHISNTPKQILIKKALGFNHNVRYAHLPIILNEENKKMSKRDKASSVKWLLEQGIQSQSIANYLILLGNSKLEQYNNETFCYDDCIQYFDVANISKNPAKFDYKKVLQINRDIIRKQPLESFYIPLESAINEIYKDSEKIKIDAHYNDVILLYLQEIHSLSQLQEYFTYIFMPIAQKRLLAKDFLDSFDTILEVLLKHYDVAHNKNYEDFKNFIIVETGLQGKYLFKPLRILLSGQSHGIELDKLYDAIKYHLHIIIRR